jgi:hypothetical protein
MTKAYAGIGSRKTPQNILDEMQRLASELAKSEFILRSGAADGADAAFEEGCDLVRGWKQIFLPWKGFNGHTSELYNIPDIAFEIAATVHPAWNYLKPYVKKFHARNVQQVLGRNCDDPVKFVVCWTPGAKKVGGTATAIRLAESRKIPVHNLAVKLDIKEAERTMNHYFASVSDKQFK